MKKIGRVVNIEGQSHILVNGTGYEVDKMLEEFKPSNLDESQRRAMIYALTSELAIIQGPPGTGKTFIGVEIVRVMLQNRTRWGIVEPILVVSFTNSAVDNFAERLLKAIYVDMEKGYLQHEGPLMARLGTKSESDYLRRSGLMRKDVVTAFPEFNTGETNAEFNSAMKRRREACRQLAEASLLLYIFKRDLASYQVLAKYKIIPDAFRSELQSWQATHCDSSGKKLDNDETLACWLLERAYTTESCARNMPEEAADETEEEDDDDEDTESDTLNPEDDETKRIRNT
ncbi:hypothetical protein COOONC_14719 [Cooperia oncophora]